MSKPPSGKSGRRSGGQDKDEKRPSVFERLGVRSHSGKHTSGTDPHEGGRWPETVRHSSSTRDSESRSRAPPPLPTDKRHSSSYSPPASKKQPGTFPGSYNPNSGQNKKIRDPNFKKSNRSDEQKHDTTLKKDKKRSSGAGSKKQGLDKKKARKPRTSSASSGDSSDYSSSPSSSSSTSSSSNNSSSSDSSVPSVKLTSGKTKTKNVSKVDKTKAKQQRPAVSASAPTPGSSYVRSSRSSSSGLDSASTPVKRGGPLPVDLREKLNARSPSGSGLKDAHQKRLGGDLQRPVVKPYDNRGPSPSGMEFDRYKKRPLQSDPYHQQEDAKRRRMLSPSPVDKYRVLPPQDEPPPHRRAPPQMQDIPKPRGRSPNLNFHKDQQYHRSGNCLDMQRRPDRPDSLLPRNNNNRDRRTSPFHPKGDYDKRRDPPAEFVRGDNRPRERVAPSRTPAMDFRQERERMDRPPLPDYQNQRRSQGRTSYNQNQPDSQPPHGRNYGYKGTSSPYEAERQTPRFPPLIEEKRQTLLPKSKEALAERYEQMRKSGYVDKWVDETVKVKSTQRGTNDETPSPLISTPSSKSALSPDRLKLEEITKESKVGESIIPPVDVDELSDFSDDADELLNVIPDSPDKENEEDASKSVSSLAAASLKKELNIPADKVPEASVASITKRSTSVETGPSTFSQERQLVAKLGGLQTSLPSQSQTDDLLDRMDFEEISDEELGEVENRVHIVDALGVDWASLVCTEKRSDEQTPESQSKSTSARKRWRPINILSGRISRKLAGDVLYNKILELKKLEDAADGGTNKDCETTHKTSKPNDAGVLEKIGLGPNSRALSARRDMAVRRHLLGLPPKSLLSLDLFHSNPTSTTPEMDSIGELYKMSIALFKANSTSKAMALT